jgi:hypothetical protein
VSSTLGVTAPVRVGARRSAPGSGVTRRGSARLIVFSIPDADRGDAASRAGWVTVAERPAGGPPIESLNPYLRTEFWVISVEIHDVEPPV